MSFKRMRRDSNIKVEGRLEWGMLSYCVAVMCIICCCRKVRPNQPPSPIKQLHSVFHPHTAFAINAQHKGALSIYLFIYLPMDLAYWMCATTAISHRNYTSSVGGARFSVHVPNRCNVRGTQTKGIIIGRTGWDGSSRQGFQTRADLANCLTAHDS